MNIEGIILTIVVLVVTGAFGIWWNKKRTYQKAKTIIGNRVSIAHNAVVHGCTVEDLVLVGMGAIIMDDAVIGTCSVIAAGAVVLPGTRVEPGSIYAGMPAKRVKGVSEEMKALMERTAKNYPMYAEWFK